MNTMKTESKIQQEIIVFFRNEYQRIGKGLIFSVPNEREGYAQMRKLIQTGLLSGVSDLIVLQKGKCMFVEIKNEIGKQSDKQKKFQKNVENLGFEYHLVRSLEQFKTII